jgi:hypothetical protein
MFNNLKEGGTDVRGNGEDPRLPLVSFFLLLVLLLLGCIHDEFLQKGGV